jgi:DNA-binding transcriptional MocR family regulator
MASVPQEKLNLVLERDSRIGLVDQIAGGLAHLIDSGAIRAGQRLPSVRQLARELVVSSSTVVESYERLVAKRLLVARRGAGFFVTKRDQVDSAPRNFTPPVPAIDSAWLLSEVFADQRVPIKAGCGWLPNRLLDGEGLRLAERRLIRAPGHQQVGYGHPYGYTLLRQTIADNLQRWALDVSPDQVLTTHGATQALDIIMRTIVHPGETVLVENPGYCNLIAMLKLARVKVVGVPRITSGVDVDALDALARMHRPKAFFTNPILQNPTGTSYTPACAMRVLQVAERHGFWIVEDDLYRELALPTDPMLAALDGLDRVIYVSGFSKTIAPSLRVGYIACAPALARKLVHTKMIMALTSSEITERLVHITLTEGRHRKHVERLSACLLESQGRLNARLESAGLTPFAPARGGMFSWASLDRPDLDTRAIADLALAKGIWLAPGEFFFLSKPDRPWFRFNVAHSDVQEISAFFADL